MDDGGPTASIIFYVALLLIDMFFYGFGSAVNSLNEKEIERRAEEDREGHSRDKKSIRLQAIIGNPVKYVNTVQLITTLINILIGTVHLRLLLKSLSGGLQHLTERQLHLEGNPAGIIVAAAWALSAFLLLYITLTLGVLLPKRLGARAPEKWAYACVTPIYFVTKLLSPFIGLVNLTTSGILRLFGIKGKVNESDVTEEEIIHMVNEGHEQGLIQASEAEMISNIFEFGDKEAQDIMTHRNYVVGIDAGTLLRDAVTFMLEGKNSRYPVYEETIDHIIGILHLKDAMRFHADEEKLHFPLRQLEGLLREPYFVPRTKNIDELFREMQAEKLQMVIVVDEYGQTDGLVAMEDILEEIVGNILDEYDVEEKFIVCQENGELVMSGMTPLSQVQEALDITFPQEDLDNYDTINGLLISRLDRIPREEEMPKVVYQGVLFSVIKVENKMIHTVRAERTQEESGREGEPDREGMPESREKDA